MSEIPIEIFNLENLKLIDLSNNNIQVLPDYFMQIDSVLKLINFAGNNLTTIPSSLFELSNVEVINLNNNDISSLPNEVCAMNPNIEISLTQNSLCLQENVPDCFESEIEFQTKCFSEIDVSGIQAIIDSNNISIEDCNCDLNMNGIVEPFEFGEHKWQSWTENARLVEAQFSGINSFPKVTFESFTKLEQLNLSENYLDTVYSEINLLNELINLDLSNNDLRKIPNELIDLNNLRTLRVNGNDSLKSIPILPQLDEIYISHTNLFCENNSFDELQLNEWQSYNVSVFGAYFQYCYMNQDLSFIYDLIEDNGYLTSWQNTGNQEWNLGRLTQFELNNQSDTDILPFSIGDLTELTHLEFSNSNIFEIPTEIENLTHLIYVDIKNNGIDTIQFDLSGFNQLQFLDISSNEIHHFPESVCELPLVEINFENNRICNEVDSPCPIFNWSEQILTQRCKYYEDILFIEELIEQNGLNYNYYNFGVQEWAEVDGEDFDRLKSFSHTRGIHSDDTLEVIPTATNNLDYLESLSLINHAILSIPNELLLLNSLTLLNLKSNNINILSTLINGLDSLNHLIIAQNQLSNVPDEIGELIYLQELDLSDNQITNLPNTLGELSNLEILNISDNLILQIPDNLENLISLITLNISGNQIDSLPEIWCEHFQIDWDNPEQFIADDNNLCDENKIPTCITIDFLNQNCD